MARPDVVTFGAERVVYSPAVRSFGFRNHERGRSYELPISAEAMQVEGVLASLREQCPMGERKTRPLQVRLARPWLQLRELPDLPRLATQDLKRLVHEHAGRFFRTASSPLCTDAVWASPQNRGAPRALAAAADPGLLQTLEREARLSGWTLTAIAVDGSAIHQRLRFQTPDISARHRRRRRKRIAGIAGGSLAALAILMLGAFLRLEANNREISARFRAIKAPALALTTLRRDMHEGQSMIAALEQAKEERLHVLIPLARIAAALPDSAVLSAFALDETGKGEVAGHARRALDVLASLDRLGLQDPQVEGSLARHPAGGRNWERFTIRFGLSP